MASSKHSNTSPPEQAKEESQHHEISLPQDVEWFGFQMHLYQNFWCLNVLFHGVTNFQTNYQPHDSHIILASLPKTGTTWLKSLLYAICNRQKVSNNLSELPFASVTPHELVPHFELEVYKKGNEDRFEMTKMPSPGLFATHMPYHSLPDSVRSSKCRIVYVCRNPFDTFVSLWMFYLKFEVSKDKDMEQGMMEEYVDKFCRGVSPFGPYTDHVLGYWEESRKHPQKVLFLEYEGLRKDPRSHLKELAEFVGSPFSKEEEEEEVVDKIIELCSLKSLKEMEINKSGMFYPWVENKALFRKGEVGDWTNHLLPSMVKRFDQILEKLEKAGFSFKYYPMNMNVDNPK